MRVLLIGNYGAENTGDDLLLEYFLTCHPRVDFVVPKARPEPGELPRLPCGIRSFLALGWIRTVRAFWSVDAVVFGGGTLFTDIESWRACVLWGVHALLCRISGRPYHLAFQGFGPFRTRIGRAISRWVFRGATAVSVRDTASLARVQDVCPGVRAVLTADPVFVLLQPSATLRPPIVDCAVLPRPGRMEALAAALDSFVTPQARVIIGSLHLADAADADKVERLRDWCRQRGVEPAVVSLRTAEDLRECLSTARHVVTERFHGAVAAAALSIPYTVVPLYPGDKLAAARDMDVAALRTLVTAGEAILPWRNSVQSA